MIGFVVVVVVDVDVDVFWGWFGCFFFCKFAFFVRGGLKFKQKKK